MEGVFPAVCMKLLKSTLSHHWNILHTGASWNSPATALRAEREECFYLQLQLTLPFVYIDSAQGETIYSVSAAPSPGVAVTPLLQQQHVDLNKQGRLQ